MLKPKVLPNEKQCFNKKLFISESEASIKLIKYEKKYKCKYRIYNCPNCLQYHLSRIKTKKP